MKNYPPIADKLGKPIEFGAPSNNDFFKYDKAYCQVMIPVEGKKRAGDLFIYASRPSIDKT
jgi:hypothetical protein